MGSAMNSSDSSDSGDGDGTAGAVVIHRLGTVASTQDEAAGRLRDGELAPFAVTARQQTGGRGRLGRSFASPEGTSLSVTAVHRSALAPGDRGWFPLAAGLAALTALEDVLGLAPEVAPEGVGERGASGALAGIGLKWPNDLHTQDGRKVGGILAEARGADHVLLGIGMNLRAPIQADGETVPGAAWLWGPGGIAPRDPSTGEEQETLRAALERSLVTALGEELRRLESTGGDGSAAGTRQRYTMTCLTLGRGVRVDPLGEIGPGGAHRPSLHGIARAIDAHGRLVVDLDGDDHVAVDVGDVRHLRPDEPVRPTTDGAPGAEQEEQRT